mmetsp:Transcript_6068/g.10456  ORF Transcript_6068/g.10456 Transcript_6068/m.10456 type:complete len:215 (+) Transcript_6068:78-722(+)|eukprot:CAMPEP_0196662746 /NCGR_PEP_ID=MMETSP1086-20130531/50142_1 /TAXON_ID=77921 /ORGANISM="Cyanoptyche  gloeocystis , Strain SAG4.97" /LENGTH=214 /DNA_ID=CAMNT_0041998301 /DNA_START=78 /DNA_END=722 /DNA_ORIENTATION=+
MAQRLDLGSLNQAAQVLSGKVRPISRQRSLVFGRLALAALEDETASVRPAKQISDVQSEDCSSEVVVFEDVQTAPPKMKSRPTIVELPDDYQVPDSNAGLGSHQRPPDASPSPRPILMPLPSSSTSPKDGPCLLPPWEKVGPVNPLTSTSVANSKEPLFLDASQHHRRRSKLQHSDLVPRDAVRGFASIPSAVHTRPDTAHNSVVPLRRMTAAS